MNNIKHLRKEKGVSQQQLGDALGLKKSTVCKWETGVSNPGFKTLMKLSKYFECTVDELFLFLPDDTVKTQSS